MNPTYSFSTQLWLTSHENPWVFITVPDEISDEIVDDVDSLDLPRRGFGSVKVEVTLGSTSWRTSLFPDTKAGGYVMPVKKPVRVAEQVDDGDTVDVTIRLVEIADR
jgi:hypothetical protein